MNKTGQISIEFMFLVLVAIIYINGVLFPLADEAAQALADVQGLSQARAAADTVRSTMHLLSGQTQTAQQTIQVVIPGGGVLDCDADADTISFSFQLSRTAAVCNNSLNCTRVFDAPAAVDLTCDPAVFPVAGPRHQALTLIRQAGNELELRAVGS